MSYPEEMTHGVLCARCGEIIATHPLAGLISEDPGEICAGCFACIVEKKHEPWCIPMWCTPRKTDKDSQ